MWPDLKNISQILRIYNPADGISGSIEVVSGFFNLFMDFPWDSDGRIKRHWWQSCKQMEVRCIQKIPPPKKKGQK